MAKFQIKFDTKKLERELNKQVKQIVERSQKKMLIQLNKEESSMNILSQNAEAMLNVFLDKYDVTKDYTINGNVSEFPEYIKFCIKDTMEDLKLHGYISSYSVFIEGGWFIVLTPEALKYFEKKGYMVELFDELVSNEKELLEEIIQIDNEDGNITEFLTKKLENDPKDIYRGIIGTLKSNGLMRVSWASDTIYYAELTQAGRSYFKRQKEYNERIEKMSSKNIYNSINATGSNVFMGDVVNSTISIDSSVTNIEKQIEEQCHSEEEKAELRELLKEAKEIVENMQESRHIDKRSGFFRKLTAHFDKHGWFYAQIVGLLGNTALNLLNGN